MSEATVRMNRERRAEAQREAAAAKEALIARAESINVSDQWRDVGAEMRVLMDQWKRAGHAGRGADDELWERFRSARQVFFDRRSEHFARADMARADALRKKRDIISEANRVLATAESNWKGAGERMRELMGEWKAAGSAGRDNEDALWREFNGIRQSFFRKRELAFERRRAEWGRNAALKGSIVSEAQSIAGSYDYSAAQRERMKSLTSRWKQVGPASREDDDRLWQAFRSAQDAFWRECSADYERRKAERERKMRDALYRKQDQVRRLQNNVANLRDRLATTFNYSKQAQIRGWISENEARVRELESQIADIHSKIGR